MKNNKIEQSLILVIFINLFYFCIEFFYANKINSVALFSDSIDFIEDVIVNLLVIIAANFNKQNRFIFSILLSVAILVPAICALQTIWQQIFFKESPDPFIFTYVSIGALIVNILCAFILSNYKEKDSNLIFVAFLSARNDVIVNIAMIAAAFITIFNQTIWPDLIVGILIFLININTVIKIIKFPLN